MKKYEFNESKAVELWGYGEVGQFAREIFSRIDEDEFEDIEEAIINATDDYLIYTVDQWALMEFYQTPREANFEEAFQMFLEDLFKVIEETGGEN